MNPEGVHSLAGTVVEDERAGVDPGWDACEVVPRPRPVPASQGQASAVTNATRAADPKQYYCSKIFLIYSTANHNASAYSSTATLFAENPLTIPNLNKHCTAFRGADIDERT